MKPSVKYNLSKLHTFVNGISKNYIVKVGIMGAKAGEDHGGINNASIGAVHEFGSTNHEIPGRSFLRMPLFMKTTEILESVKKNSLMPIALGNFRQVLVNLGIACENIIDTAFNTSGFGTWKKLKARTISKKIGQNPMPLINTSQLRRSIMSQVEEVI